MITFLKYVFMYIRMALADMYIVRPTEEKSYAPALRVVENLLVNRDIIPVFYEGVVDERDAAFWNRAVRDEFPEHALHELNTGMVRAVRRAREGTGRPIRFYATGRAGTRDAAKSLIMPGSLPLGLHARGLYELTRQLVTGRPMDCVDSIVGRCFDRTAVPRVLRYAQQSNLACVRGKELSALYDSDEFRICDVTINPDLSLSIEHANTTLQERESFRDIVLEALDPRYQTSP